MDQEKLHKMAFNVVNDMAGSFTMALAYVGDHLGLFKGLEQLDRTDPTTLAHYTNLNERYVREWLKAMVSSEYVEMDQEDNYYLTPEAKCLFVNEDHPFFMGGSIQFTTPSLYNVPRILDAFRKGGGIPYDEIGDKIPCAIERFFRPGYINFLVQEWLPKVPGLVLKLESGAVVADIGCGRGESTITMAKAFKKSRFYGIDSCEMSIAKAMKKCTDQGIGNITWVVDSAEELNNLEPFDLVCSFDCIHDMSDPIQTLKAIHRNLKEDGDYLWSEPNASHDPRKNRNPQGRLFHSISPLHCLTVSLAHNGAGLGTVIGEEGARVLSIESGYSYFTKLKIDNPFNQFFHLRK